MLIRLIILFFLIPLAASAQKNISLLGQLYYPDGLSDIWGYEEGGRLYALVGTNTGPSIVDITDPTQPVELFYFPRPFSIWWDLKSWNDHAYVVNETGGGLLIIDMSGLPNQADTTSWTGGALDLKTAHNLFIDENGIAYIFGSNVANQGALMLDLTQDPKDPVFLGLYDDHYVHDGYVRGDTLWTSEIYSGQFSVVDVSVKTNPVVLARHPTPDLFTHNCWLNDDGSVLITTDERSGAFIAAYDVSDLSDITELDRYQSHPGNGVIPHNTFFKGNFIFTSYYRDGVTMVDATRPDNMVETGFYDTSPFPPGDGFEGCWGVYPYFSNGVIVASDRQEGLFILQPELKRAAYLEGVVSNATTGSPLHNATVEIMGAEARDATDLFGNYKTGVADSGKYDIRFTAPDCVSQIVTGVVLDDSLVTQLNVSLTCPTTGVYGVAEEPRLSISYRNNPLIHYEFPGSNNLQLVISDLSGKIVVQEFLTQPQGIVQVDQELSAGMYLATIYSSHISASKKMFINR